MELRDGEWLVSVSGDTHPREVMVELTTACNYNCIFCFRRATDEALNAFMSEETFNKLIRDSEEALVDKLSFTGWGEVFVHPSALKFLRMSKEAGFKVLVATNGSLLPKVSKDLIDLGIDELYVSVDSLRSELYNMLRVGGNLSNVTKGLLEVYRLKRELGVRKPDVTLQMTLNKANASDLAKLPEYALRVGASRAVVSLMIPLTPEMERSLSCLASEECIREVELMREEVERLAPYITIVMPNTTVAAERRCPFISKMATYVRWDGSVAPCIYYAHGWRHSFQGIMREIKPVSFGNIRKKSLLNIWRSKEYVAFRFRTYFFRMPSCLDCPIRNYCSLTLSNDMDCWGNTPTCAFCPFSHDMVRCPL